MAMKAANDNASPSRIGPFVRSTHFGFVLVALLALVPVIAFGAGSTFWIGMATRVAIFALAALSLGFVLGQGGLVSFGQAAPLGLGAYAVLIAGEYGLSEGLVVLPLAALVGGAFTLVTGAIALRARGPYFIMITLAFAQMAYFTFTSLSAFGGDDGMTLASRVTIAGARVLRGDLALAYAAIGLLAACLFLLQRVAGSEFGRAFRGLKENESRLAALGIPAYPYRLVAYAIGGAVAGLAGALLANQTEFVSPGFMNWQRSGELIVMVVLGGLGQLHGAILGAAIVVVLEEMLAHATEHWRLAFGLLLVGVVLWRGAAEMRRG